MQVFVLAFSHFRPFLPCYSVHSQLKHSLDSTFGPDLSFGSAPTSRQASMLSHMRVNQGWYPSSRAWGSSAHSNPIRPHPPAFTCRYRGAGRPPDRLCFHLRFQIIPTLMIHPSFYFSCPLQRCWEFTTFAFINLLSCLQMFAQGS